MVVGVVRFGLPRNGMTPIAGDWDGNGTTDIGFYDPRTSTWFLRAGAQAVVQFVDVMDSNAVGAVITAVHSHDSGDNENWRITP